MHCWIDPIIALFHESILFSAPSSLLVLDMEFIRAACPQKNVFIFSIVSLFTVRGLESYFFQRQLAEIRYRRPASAVFTQIPCRTVCGYGIFPDKGGTGGERFSVLRCFYQNIQAICRMAFQEFVQFRRNTGVYRTDQLPMRI